MVVRKLLTSIKLKFTDIKVNLLNFLKKYYVPFLILFLLFLPIFWIFADEFIFIESSTVTKRELEPYIKEYFEMYDYLYEDNQNYFIEIKEDVLVSTTPDDMWFRYMNYPSKIEGVISKQRGAAVIYDYETNARESNIAIKKIDDEIEYYIWPDMSTSIDSLESVYLSGEFVLDDTINVGKALLIMSKNSKIISTTLSKSKPSFNVDENGAIKIYGELIIEDNMILKGENNRIFWSRPQADLDALSQFLFDCNEVLNTTEVSDIKNKYKSSFLLEKILYGIKTEFYKKNPHYFYDNFNDLKNSDFENDIIISNIWDSYSELQMYVKPTLMKRILTDEWIRNYIMVVIGAFVVYEYGNWRGSKRE